MKIQKTISHVSVIKAVLREFEKRVDIEIISYAIPGSTRVIDLISIRYRFDIDRCLQPTSMWM